MTLPKAPMVAGTWRLKALPDVEAELQRDGCWTLWAVEPGPNGKGRLLRRLTAEEAGGPVTGSGGREEMMRVLDRVVLVRGAAK